MHQVFFNVCIYAKQKINLTWPNVKLHQSTFYFSLGSSSLNHVPIDCFRGKGMISFLSLYLCIFSRNLGMHIRCSIIIAKATKTSKIKSLATIINGFPQTSKTENFVTIINFKLHPLKELHHKP